MGSSSSSLSELSSNEYLQRLASTESLTPNDPFWNQLLSFTFAIPRTSAEQGFLEETTVNLCKNFVVNNGRTGNFSALVHVFLRRADELNISAQCQDNIFTWQTYNSLFVIRNICKYFVENLTEEALLQQFHTQATTDGLEAGADLLENPLFDSFLDCLTKILIDVPIVDVTYAIHLECLSLLLTLLSIQLSHPQPFPQSKMYRHVMNGTCSLRAIALVETLLRNYMQQLKCPPQLHTNSSQHGRLYGVTSAIASGLWTVVTLGLANQKATKPGTEYSEALLANQSVLLLLVMANHSCSDGGVTNPYRDAFFSCVDSSSASEPVPDSSCVAVNYGYLYTTLCTTLHSEQTTLFLYMLLHRVESVRSFILSRTNIDQLVMPILKILYHAPDGSSHHIYMALIIILILSEDSCFSKSVHEILLKNIVWFQERQISEITLGGLLILVLVRTIQYNMTRLRDQYLHTNCLAALANMSSQFNALHPYVAQRLVSLFASLLKKYTRAVQRMQEAAAANHSAEKPSMTADGSCVVNGLSDADQAQEIAVVEEVLRMMLEIFNSCLSSSLHHNPNLIYTMLYQRALFTPLLSHHTFQDIVCNIDTVLSFFTAQLDRHSNSPSVAEVHAIIKQSSVLFKRERLKKFAELKFRYVEEDRPEEFFVPYVWSLVYHGSNLYFNPSRVQLFSIQNPTASP